MSTNNSEYVKQFTSETNLGKEALGAVTMVGLKKVSDGVTTLNTELPDSAIKDLVGRPALNEMIEENIPTYTITTSVYEGMEDYGTAAPETQTVQKSQNATVTAIANEGYTFSGWNRSGEEGSYEYESTDAEYTIENVSADKTLVAYFE